MANYDFKCTKCKKIARDISLPMADYDEASKLVKCCGEAMDSHFDSSNAPAIVTKSSPIRGSGK